MTEEPSAPPGWYDYDGEERWWTGSKWGMYQSEYPGPPRGAVAAQVATQEERVGGGWYVWAVIFPIVGLIAGLTFMAKGKAGGGVVALTSVAAWVIWILIFTGA